jgi:hypothetical protein
MGMECWRVETPDGRVLGYAGYQNTAAVWCEPIWPTRSAYISAHNERRIAPHWGCDAPAMHELVECNLWFDDDNDLWVLKVCEQCRAIVPPPYDGCWYHDYGCTMEGQCSCCPDRHLK